MDGFLNPNGVAYVSPGLAARGAAYPGNVRPKCSNPNGVASMQELSRRVSQTLWVCLISGVFFVRVLLMGLCLGVSSRWIRSGCLDFEIAVPFACGSADVSRK